MIIGFGLLRYKETKGYLPGMKGRDFLGRRKAEQKGYASSPTSSAVFETNSETKEPVVGEKGAASSSA